MGPIFEYNFSIVEKIKTWGNLHKITQKFFFCEHMKILKDLYWILTHKVIKHLR